MLCFSFFLCYIFPLFRAVSLNVYFHSQSCEININVLLRVTDWKILTPLILMREKWVFLLKIHTFSLFTYWYSTVSLYVLILVFIYLFFAFEEQCKKKKRKNSQNMLRENVTWKACRSHIEWFNYILGFKDITFGTVHCPRCTWHTWHCSGCN